MSSRIRWLHLSDFHVGKDDYAERKIFEYIIEHVKQQKNAGLVPDLIFITGDIANKGLRSEYEDFWLEFMLPLQEILGGDISKKTFIVPGNHDADREHNQAFDRNEMLEASSLHFDPTEKGLRARKMLLPRFQAFSDDDQTSGKGAFLKAEGAFSTVLTIGGEKIGIAGINTAWLCKDKKDERNLTPGKGMVEAALMSLKDVKLRIVLGHHPLDWFLPAEKKPIKCLFGNNSVLYLHGHLHEEWAEPTYGGGHQFLAIQSGAAFQAREREKWRNGLVWGEVDLDGGEVLLQPRHWIPGQQAWVPVTDAFHENYRQKDWWHYPLPGSGLAKQISKVATPKPPHPPRGWAVYKPSELTLHVKALETEVAISFFNGATPSWGSALSASIPRRKIVETLATRFHGAAEADRAYVTVLLAAGCEGKTTAMLQAAYKIVEGNSSWRVLHRFNDVDPFTPEDILAQLTKENHWLVVIDEADREAKKIMEFLRRLPSDLQGRVHFLLACRDSDWLGSNANKLRWPDVCQFQPERLSGLDIDDAAAIVKAWGAFGNRGLGDMEKIKETERASLLASQARVEAKTQKGALFGALLTARHGSDLPNHARQMLDRLSQHSIPGGKTLQDALAFVAAMHAENLEFLCRPVLAQALGCERNRLHRNVLLPLGQEAATTSTSTFVFTRHRRIAQALLEVLENEFGIDIDSLYIDLAKSAIDVAKVDYLPSVTEWRHTLSKHFFEAGKVELSLRIANGVLSREPMDPKTIVNVSNLYRNAGVSDKAVDLFREIPASKRMNRGFYSEWGTAEGLNGDSVANVILLAYSLSDDCETSRVDNNDAVKALASLGVAFAKLYNRYNEPSFRDARVAVAVLGKQLRLDETATRHFRTHLEEGEKTGAILPTVDDAFPLFTNAIAKTEEIGANSVVDAVVPDAVHLDFKGLQLLLAASVESIGAERVTH